MHVSFNSGAIYFASEADKALVASLVEDLSYSQSNKTQDNDSIVQITDQAVNMPLEIRGALTDFARSRDSYLLLTGLSSPKHNELVLLVTAELGTQFAHHDEGPLVMAAKPDKAKEGTNHTAYYTWNRFDLHTELPYVTSSPDYLALRCVSNVSGGFTYVANVDRALALLPESHLIELKKPQFLIPIPPHFGVPELLLPPRPILTPSETHHGRFNLRVRFDSLESSSDAAREAVSALRDALDAVREAIELQPDSILIINNKSAAHGRAPFVPTFGNDDRELRRVYVKNHQTFSNIYDHHTRRIKGF